MGGFGILTIKEIPAFAGMTERATVMPADAGISLSVSEVLLANKILA